MLLIALGFLLLLVVRHFSTIMALFQVVIDTVTRIRPVPVRATRHRHAVMEIVMVQGIVQD